MNEQSTNNPLAYKLHRDHLASRNFMGHVAGVVEPFYDNWIATHSWNEISLSEATVVPSLWRGLSVSSHSESTLYKTAAVDWEGKYAPACPLSEFSDELLEQLLDTGLWNALDMARVADLHCEPEKRGFTSADIHRAERSIFSRDKLLPTQEPAEDIPQLGEILITNIGEGAAGDYGDLHHARIRCAKFITYGLGTPLHSIATTYPVEVNQLSRAIVTAQSESFQPQQYNPLTHTMLEGMMGVGQAVNYFVQPGIDGFPDAKSAMKSVLANNLPAIMSKIMINGHLGPNQLAGLSIQNAAFKTEHGAQINPKLFDNFRDEKQKAMSGLQNLHGEYFDYEAMQLPDVQAVNRYEGCPANRLVRLMDRMLLDALSTAD